MNHPDFFRIVKMFVSIADRRTCGMSVSEALQMIQELSDDDNNITWNSNTIDQFTVQIAKKMTQRESSSHNDKHIYIFINNKQKPS